MTLLGVNIDHVATLRQQRKEGFPDPLEAARLAIEAGADSITVHLREDRRHIQEEDVFLLIKNLGAPLNLEMAASEEILQIAQIARPAWACIVPEKRQELTTEGGLDLNRSPLLITTVKQLKAVGTRVSFFVEPNIGVVRQAKALGADAVELHTGAYAAACGRKLTPEIQRELARLKAAAGEAETQGLLVNAGHGISYENVEELSAIHPFHEFNIGFAIVARAVMVGFKPAVSEMKQKMASICVAS